MDTWAYFFREAKNLNVVLQALSETPFRDALEVVRTANFSSDEWEAYERAKMAEQDARGALTVARQEGKEEGIAEGKRGALLRLLARGEIPLAEKDHARIVSCGDLATLDRWFDKALVARTATEVFS
jgi:predicted transposase/invertase (TIGR01784 family)